MHLSDIPELEVKTSVSLMLSDLIIMEKLEEPQAMRVLKCQRCKNVVLVS